MISSASSSVPLLISSWRISPYIILVWSDAAFAYITSSKNKCINYKKNDSAFFVPCTFGLVHFVGSKSSMPLVKHTFGSENVVLVYNASKLAVSLTLVVQSNVHARFFSLNQPRNITQANPALKNNANVVPVLFENQAVHALYPLLMNSKIIAVEKFDRELLEMVAHTQLSAEEEERLLVIYPNDYDQQVQEERDEYDFEIFA